MMITALFVSFPVSCKRVTVFLIATANEVSEGYVFYTCLSVHGGSRGPHPGGG